MPILALALNLSYELFRVLTINTDNIIVLVGLYGWLILDSILLIIYFIYGDYLIKRGIVKVVSGVFLTLLFFIVHLIGVKYLSNYTLYSVFVINIIMSLIYLMSLFKLDKKNYVAYIIIGVSKCIGTLFASITYGVIEFNLVTLILGIFILLIDLISILFGIYRYKTQFLLN